MKSLTGIITFSLAMGASATFGVGLDIIEGALAGCNTKVNLCHDAVTDLSKDLGSDVGAKVAAAALANLDLTFKTAAAAIKAAPGLEAEDMAKLKENIDEFRGSCDGLMTDLVAKKSVIRDGNACGEIGDGLNSVHDIVGSLADALQGVAGKVQVEVGPDSKVDLGDWTSAIADIRKSFDLGYGDFSDGKCGGRSSGSGSDSGSDDSGSDYSSVDNSSSGGNTQVATATQTANFKVTSAVGGSVATTMANSAATSTSTATGGSSDDSGNSEDSDSETIASTTLVVQAYPSNSTAKASSTSTTITAGSSIINPMSAGLGLMSLSMAFLIFGL